MNKWQRRILVLGVGATVPVLAFGPSRPPVVGPLVEYAPGQYSREFTDVVLPKRILITALGLAVLTGAALYWTRTTRKTP